ncbi:MAG: hypothetical protein ABW168_07310 [Sedimenticola sp.]
MRCVTALLIITVLFLAGCTYEKPLVKEHAIPVDSSVLGLWEPQPDGGEELGTEERMIILKFSDTEYLIHYPPGGNDETYYRGYPIKIGGIPCVQLQVIGTEDGMPKKDVKALFAVMSYELKKDILEIRTLNNDLVDDDLKTTEALVHSFLNHKDNKELFTNPVRFRQLKD